MTPDRVDKDRLILFDGIFDEVEDCFCSCILGVENNLVLKIKPLECQVDDTSALPVVWDLLPSTIDDVSDFVGDHKLLVLGSKAVSDKKPVFNLDGSYHILRELLHVHLVHLLLPHHELLLVLELLLLLSLLLLTIVAPHHFLGLLLIFLINIKVIICHKSQRLIKIK